MQKIDDIELMDIADIRPELTKPVKNRKARALGLVIAFSFPALVWLTIYKLAL